MTSKPPTHKELLERLIWLKDIGIPKAEDEHALRAYEIQLKQLQYNLKEVH